MLTKAAAREKSAQDVDAYALESISALYGLLEAEARCPSGSHQALPASVDEAMRQLNHVRDVARNPSNRDEWSELADSIHVVEQNLAQIAGACVRAAARGRAEPGAR